MGAGLDLTKIQTKAQKKYIDFYCICYMYGNWKQKEKKQKDLITCSERERYKTERNLLDTLGDWLQGYIFTFGFDLLEVTAKVHPIWFL